MDVFVVSLFILSLHLWVSGYAPCLIKWSCDLVLDDRPESHMASVWERIQRVAAVKHTSFHFFNLSLISFLLPFIWVIISAFSPELIVFTCSPLCAAVLMHSPFILVLLSSCSHLFESLCHVTWTNRLLLKAGRQPRASILTRVSTCRLYSLHARIQTLNNTLSDIIGLL